MYRHIHTEKREQEPNRRIAVEMTLHPNVTPSKLVPISVQFIREKEKQPKIQHTSDNTPRQIGDNQTFELVLQKKLGWSRYAFVEITCLEEKEADEEEGPGHQLIKPKCASPEPTHTHTMQDNHPENAQSAKQIKSMIPLFHTDKGTIKRRQYKINQIFFIVECEDRRDKSQIYKKNAIKTIFNFQFSIFNLKKSIFVP
jgi:hypothetical protein